MSKQGRRQNGNSGIHVVKDIDMHECHCRKFGCHNIVTNSMLSFTFVLYTKMIYVNFKFSLKTV